jgi:hypothetical protein
MTFFREASVEKFQNGLKIPKKIPSFLSDLEFF